MIQRLRVENYAIVQQLEIDFEHGLTILSGETGAGKSILIGALDLILGGRASTDAVRAGEALAVVEADISDLPEEAVDELRNLDIEVDEGCVTFRREVQAKGTSRAFVNGCMIPLASLKKIASTMFDLVGQHQQQYLINKEHHVRFLDAFGSLTELRDHVAAMVGRMAHITEELSRLRETSNRRKETTELYRFQIQEIERAGLSAQEEESLLSERRVLENAEKITATLGDIADLLSADDQSVTSRLAQAEKMLREAAAIDTVLSELTEGLAGSRYVLEDIGRTLASRAESIENDPRRLQQIEERLDLYYDLKKKYGGSIDALNEYCTNAKSQLNSDIDLSSRIESLEIERKTALERLTKSAIQLSESRAKQAALLSKRVEKEIAQLGIAKGEFKVRVDRGEDPDGLVEWKGTRYRAERNGIDDVEFYFCANRGEEVRPLSKVASGGELSRVMLALKSVGATRKKLETLIFDEVDSGIGGEVASAVGRKLRQLAEKHQIIVITHLQQIAAAGEHHFRVYKEKSAGRMITRIGRLDENERREEIGRMLSGEKVTETSLKQAEELLEQFDRS